MTALCPRESSSHVSSCPVKTEAEEEEGQSLLHSDLAFSQTHIFHTVISSISVKTFYYGYKMQRLHIFATLNTAPKHTNTLLWHPSDLADKMRIT